MDAEIDSFVRLCDIVIKNWVQSGFLEESSTNMVREVLYAPKLHLIDGHVRSVNDSSMTISDKKFTGQQMSIEEDEQEPLSGSSKFEDVSFLE